MTENNGYAKYAEMKIYSIATNLTDSVIFLDEINGSRILPIWIGSYEAQSIVLKLSGYPSPRPMTHDLLFNVIRKSGLTVNHVCVNDVQDKTFFAYIFLEKEAGGKNGSFKVDSRPSDALAMAVRFGCPIFVHEDVFEKAETLAKPISEEEVRQFKRNISQLKPSDIIRNLKPRANNSDGDIS